ncbi:MAG TPA: hypothetical protein VF973_14830, partial [Myxococcales bacterium]
MRREGSVLGTALVALAAAGWGTWALFVRGRGLTPAWGSVLILSVIAAASLPGALVAALLEAALASSSSAHWMAATL